MRIVWIGEVGVNGCERQNQEGSSRMPEEVQKTKLRLTCPPCGEVFTADNEDTLVAMAVEHARKFHDMNLLEQYGRDELRALARRENEAYWARIAHLIPDGEVKTVLDEKLCDREREIVSYVVHGFPNREIAERLYISERTVSTHLVNVYEKLNVHSRAELAAIVRATDRIIEAALRGDGKREYGPFVRANGPKPR
jgi:DNA-binding CsgD family transcriptional regulator/predicted small metal-binding protein